MKVAAAVAYRQMPRVAKGRHPPEDGSS